jgi:hypothetical protein
VRDRREQNYWQEGKVQEPDPWRNSLREKEIGKGEVMEDPDEVEKMLAVERTAA